MIGAQKCTVFGPIGLFHNFANPVLSGPVTAGSMATPATVRRPAGRIADWRRKGDGRKAERRSVQVLRGAAIAKMCFW